MLFWATRGLGTLPREFRGIEVGGVVFLEDFAFGHGEGWREVVIEVEVLVVMGIHAGSVGSRSEGCGGVRGNGELLIKFK